ncbi:MAG: DUF5996 family protein [Rhodospirillales bacterium]
MPASGPAAATCRTPPSTPTATRPNPASRRRPFSPAQAKFDPALGEFLLPYDAVRTADDPDATLLAFLQTTYEAAANAGQWDRPALEIEEGQLGRPRLVA